MTSQKIGIDVDETIAALYEAVLDYGKQLHPSIGHFTIDMLINDNWWTIPEFGLTKEQSIGMFPIYEKFDPTHEHVSPILNSVEGIGFLKKRGYSLSAITGRNEAYARNSTFRWLDKHFPNAFSEVIFTNHNSGNETRRNKSEVCKELWIRLMIEDNLDFALELAQNGIASYVLRRPWNRERPEQHRLITRVNGWDDIILQFS